MALAQELPVAGTFRSLFDQWESRCTPTTTTVSMRRITRITTTTTPTLPTRLTPRSIPPLPRTAETPTTNLQTPAVRHPRPLKGYYSSALRTFNPEEELLLMEEDCCICFEEKRHSLKVQTGCGHEKWMCKECLAEGFQAKIREGRCPNCPFCRAAVPLEVVTSLHAANLITRQERLRWENNFGDRSREQ
jgi:hypothetical protein